MHIHLLKINQEAEGQSYPPGATERLAEVMRLRSKAERLEG
jgi:hypothetical protein